MLVSRTQLIIPFLVSFTFFFHLSAPSPVSQGFQTQFEQEEDLMLNDFCKTLPTNLSATDENKFSQSIFEKIRGDNPLIKIIGGPGSKNKNTVIERYENTMTPILILLWVVFFVALFCNLGIFGVSYKLGKQPFRLPWIKKIYETKKEYIIGFNIIILILLLLLGLSGFTLSERIVKNTNTALCAWNNLLNDIQKGSPADHWFGLLPLLNLLRSLDDSVILLRRKTEKLGNMSRNSINSFSDFLSQKGESNLFISIHEIPRADPEITDPYLPDSILSSIRLKQPHPTDAQRILDELELWNRWAQSPVSELLDRSEYYLRDQQTRFNGNPQDLLRACSHLNIYS